MTQKISKNLLVLFVTLLFAAAGYSFLWFKAAEESEEKLIAFIASQEEKGYAVRYDRIETKGFPFYLALEIVDPSIIMADKNLKISTSTSLLGHVSVFNPTKLRLETTGPLSVSAAAHHKKEHSPIFEAQNASLTLDLLDTKNFTWTVNEAKGQNIIIAQEMVLDSTPPTYKFEAKGIEFKDMPLGKLDQIGMTWKFDLPKPPAPFSLKAYLQTVYEADGVLDVQSFNLVKGKFKVQGNGGISLDQELQPIVVFSSEIQNADVLVDFMAEQNLLHKNLAPILKAALMSFATKADKGSADPVHKVSINLQGQELSIANIPIVKFEPINWDVFNVR